MKTASRRRQVHKVDAGNQQNKGGNSREHVDIRDVAVRLDLAPVVGAQMDVRQRLEIEKLPVATLLFLIAYISRRHLPKLLLQCRHVGPLAQAQIGVVTEAPPVPLATRAFIQDF
jgi:hypothetical protein